MNFLKAAFLFVIALYLWTADGKGQEVTLSEKIPTQPGNIAKTLQNYHFPRNYLLKPGIQVETKWNGEIIQLEVRDWEPPIRFGLEKKNSRNFSEYLVFYELDGQDPHETTLTITHKWVANKGLLDQWKDRIFYPYEAKREMNDVILAIQKDWVKK